MVAERRVVMKNFLRTNLYYIIRLIGTQVGISIFAMMLQFATISISTDLHLVASIGAVVFYFVLIYSTCWEMGYKSSERIAAGRLIQSPFHGAYVQIAAYVPVIVLLIALWVGFAFGNLVWGGSMFFVVKWILYVYFSVYHGLINAVIKSLSLVDFQTVLYPLLYTLSLIPGIAVAGVSYYLGRRGIALFSKPKQNID